jgi:hypothetical protein
MAETPYTACSYLKGPFMAVIKAFAQDAVDPAEPLTVAAACARASPSPKPPTTISGSPRSSSGTSRAPKTNAIASVARRRATKATACADARSSHCASSTTHSSGRSAAIFRPQGEQSQRHQQSIRRVASA